MTPILVATLAALAQAQPASAPADQPSAEKKVCRSVDVTGSIFPKKTCHTRAEWAKIDEGNARSVRDFRERAGVGPSPR